MQFAVFRPILNVEGGPEFLRVWMANLREGFVGRLRDSWELKRDRRSFDFGCAFAQDDTFLRTCCEMLKQNCRSSAFAKDDTFARNRLRWSSRTAALTGTTFREALLNVVPVRACLLLDFAGSGYLVLAGRAKAM
jgi:hypothetical protein